MEFTDPLFVIYRIRSLTHCRQRLLRILFYANRGVQHYLIKFVSNLRQVGGILRVLRFPRTVSQCVFIGKFCCRVMVISIYHNRTEKSKIGKIKMIHTLTDCPLTCNVFIDSSIVY
jgi:hypothetical protein